MGCGKCGKCGNLPYKKQKLLSPNGNLHAKSDIYKMPLYRTAHSPENFSDEWAFIFLYIKYTFVVTQIATKSWIKNHLFSFVPE